MRQKGRTGWALLAGPVACATLAAAVLVGYTGDATAAPSGAAPGADSARRNGSVASTRDALTDAERRLAQLEAAAQQAGQAHRQAVARVRVAKQDSAQALVRAQVARAARAQAAANLGRLAAAVYRYGPAREAGTLFLVLDVTDPMSYLEGIHTVRRVLANASSVAARATQTSQAADAASAAATAQAAALADAERQSEQSAVQAVAAATAVEDQVTVLGGQLDALLGREGIGPEAEAELAAEMAGAPGLVIGSGVPYDAATEAKAIAFALAQLGKPYVWGGTGPASFDCSGLAMRAYGSAGIELPHFAAFQYAASNPLTYGQLRPGDLLFWASDPKDPRTIYHEAIYLGGQQMVQAPKTGWNVMVSNMWMWGRIQFFARPHR